MNYARLNQADKNLEGLQAGLEVAIRAALKGEEYQLDLLSFYKLVTQIRSDVQVCAQSSKSDSDPLKYANCKAV